VAVDVVHRLEAVEVEQDYEKRLVEASHASSETQL